MTNGLATPIRKENDLMSGIRKAFGKGSGTPMPLEKRLERLSEQDLYGVIQTAQFVKMAHSFGSPDTPYKDLVNSMYPKYPYNLRNIVAEVLQEAEPIEPKQSNKSNRRDEIISEVHKSYEAIEEV
tara:strand:+ start:151 stop:528 length:378 start_codon:yes stop_codon:yes gene_type:complete